ncbi:MAG: hypothetical protein ACJAT2_001769 [Bacteriovoracaceae bacterium]
MNSIEENNPLKQGDQIYFFRAFMLFMLAHFILNLLGSPLVLYSGALVACTAFFSVIFLKWQQAFYIAVLYTLVGGQIKVIWGYNPFFRLVGDFLMVILVFRNFVNTRKLFDFTKVPNFVVWLIVGHFLWFIVCLFNPNGAGLFASFASGKFYILPIFYFFAIISQDFDITSRYFKDFLKVFMFFVILEAILVIYQSIQGPEFMFSMNNNYKSLFEKFTLFAEESSFRPWGTTAHPGGYSTFFFLSSGFTFLWTVQPGGDEEQKLSLTKKLFVFTFTIFTLFAVFISQVRASFIKEVLIIALGLFFSFIGTRFAAKRIITVGVGVIAVLFVGSFTLNKTTNFEQIMSFGKALERIEALDSIDRMTKQRSSVASVFNAIGTRFSRPMGLGLGMTSDYLPAYIEKRRRMVDIKPLSYWSYDNLFVSLAGELGIGALFLILTIIGVPLILTSLMFSALREKNYVVFRTVCYCAVSVLVITVGQWGAIGIIYPPEFQYYWFYVALAMTAYYKAFPKVQGSRPKY